MAKPNSISILLGVPTANYVENECFLSILQATNTRDPRVRAVRVIVKTGYLVDMNRNAIVKEAVDGNMDYVMMVDSDTIIPSHIITSFLNAFESDPKIKMVAGWQHRKLSHDGQTETFQEDGQQNFVERIKGDVLEILGQEKKVIEIKGTGFGAVMIKVDAIKEMMAKNIVPFRYVVYNPFIRGSCLSEDNYFCEQLKRVLGHKIVCATDVKCGHIWKEVN